MIKKVLIDTDIILDFFFDRAPFAENSAIILSFCELGKIQGFVTPVIISNIYYLLRREAKNEKVLENLSILLELNEVINIDKEVILASINSNFKDFEAALQNFAAIKFGEIDCIVTRNLKDYKHSELTVFAPQTLIKNIENDL